LISAPPACFAVRPRCISAMPSSRLPLSSMIFLSCVPRARRSSQGAALLCDPRRCLAPMRRQWPALLAPPAL
jgi:hypothetical protein